MAKTKKSTLFLAQFGILLAIEAIFCFTPLGALPAMGPIVATLAMIPIVITAILLGTKAGTAMGAFAGLFSFLVWTFMPPSPVAFVFTPFSSFGEINGNLGSLLICFVPRILVGTVTGIVCKAISKVAPTKNVLSYSVSALLGSLTNTFGVLLGIWLFFGDSYVQTIEALSQVETTILILIGTTILTSGIPEAIIAAIAASAVCKPLKTILKKSTE